MSSLNKFAELVMKDELQFITIRLLIVTTQIKENIRLRRFLTRDFISDIERLEALKQKKILEKRQLFEKLNRLKENLSETYSALSQAHDDLRSAKEDINRWHRKSKSNMPFYGNAGEKLPSHSLFGQSFGDLEDYKADRSAAVSEIGTTKTRISDLKTYSSDVYQKISEVKAEIGSIFDEIGALGSSQSEKERLERSGVSVGMLNAEYPLLTKDEEKLMKERTAIFSAVKEIQHYFSKSLESSDFDL